MSKTYFISGHRDITEEDFSKHYEQKIFDAINEGASFVVGDCKGADTMAQKYLKAMICKNVTVYHMFEEPRFNAGFKTIGGFKDDIQRDYQMTVNSNDDIAWVQHGRERSGTAANLERRKLYREGKLQ